MVGRASGIVGLGLKFQAGQIQIIQEDINDANRAVFCDLVIELFGK